MIHDALDLPDDVRRWLPPDPEMLPDVWTDAFVGKRLVEAYGVLQRLPRERSGPRGHGCGMPAYVHDRPQEKWVWNVKRKVYQKIVTRPADVDHMGHVDETDVPRETIARPTGAEQEIMWAVLGWPGRFLSHDAELANCVASWALWTAQDRDVDATAERLYFAKARAFQAKRREGLRVIARGLNEAGEGVV